MFHSYDVTADGIYFIGRSDGKLALRLLASADGVTRTIAPVAEGYVGLSVSPDRESVLYTVANPFGGNLSLIDGFR